MVSVQRSIEIRVPVHMLYEQLMQFEDYPQFMQDIESVEQRDETHLHWKAKLMDEAIEWDATITEREPDRCIAWQSESGPGNAGKVEMQAVGPAASRLTFTLVSEMDIEPSTPAGDIKAELSERIWENLARLRSLVESRQQHEEPGMRGGPEQSARGIQRSPSGYAAGSEGFSGTEDPSSPVVSASHLGGLQDNPEPPEHSLPHGTQIMDSNSQSIAEEVNFDQQSGFARKVGQLSSGDEPEPNQGLPNADVIAKVAQRKRPEPEV